MNGIASLMHISGLIFMIVVGFTMVGRDHQRGANVEREAETLRLSLGLDWLIGSSRLLYNLKARL